MDGASLIMAAFIGFIGGFIFAEYDVRYGIKENRSYIYEDTLVSEKDTILIRELRYYEKQKD